MSNPPGGCAHDSAAKAHLVGRSGEGARTERGTERRADRPTDGRPRTRRRTELSPAPVTHSHTHTLAHSQGHTHTRALTSSRQPARPPLAGARIPEPALAGKCGVSVGAFVWGAGRRKAQGPSQGCLAIETSSSPPGPGSWLPPPPRPHGAPCTPGLGEGSPTQGRRLGARELRGSSSHSPWSLDAIPGRDRLGVRGPSLCGRG